MPISKAFLRPVLVATALSIAAFAAPASAGSWNYGATQSTDTNRAASERVRLEKKRVIKRGETNVVRRNNGDRDGDEHDGNGRNKYKFDRFGRDHTENRNSYDKRDSDHRYGQFKKGNRTWFQRLDDRARLSQNNGGWWQQRSGANSGFNRQFDSAFER